MALTNQATISLAVNIRNLTKVEQLTTAFQELRQTIITMQRSTQGVSGLARGIKQAVEDAKNIAPVMKNANAHVEDFNRLNKQFSANMAQADAHVKDFNTQEKRFAWLMADANSHVKAYNMQQDRFNKLMAPADSHVEAFNREQKRQASLLYKTDPLLRDYNREQARRAKIERDSAKAIQRANRAYAERVARERAVQAAHDERITRELAANRKQEQSMKGLAYRLRHYEERLDAVFRAGFRLQMVGQDLRFLGQRIFDFMGGVMDTFGEFEFMAGRAAGALGPWTAATEEGFLALQDSVIDSAEALRLFETQDVAKSLYFLASTTGQVVDSQEDLDDIMRSLEPIMKMAALTETDYETAIKGVYSILVQYNGELVKLADATGDYTAMADKMNDISIKLFYTTQKTAAEFPDLINAFKMVGPVAAQAGASFEDMLDLIGRLADIGLRGSLPGRALRQVFIQMVRPSGPAKAALKDLFDTASRTIDLFKGKSYTEIMFPEGEFVGTTQYIRNLALATKDLSYQERSMTLARISTANMLPVLTALISEETAALEANRENVSKTSKAQEEAADVFEQAWNRLSNSWKGVTGAVQRGIEALQITVGRAFAEAFAPFLEMVTEGIDKLRAWARENQETVMSLGRLASAVGAALVVFGALASLAGGLIALGAGVSLIVRAFKPLFGAIGGLAAIVTAMVDSVIRNFDSLQAGFQEIERAFSEVTGGIEEGSTSIIDVISDIYEPFQTMADVIVRSIAAIMPHIANFIRLIGSMDGLSGGVEVLARSLTVLFSVRLLSTMTGFIRKTSDADKAQRELLKTANQSRFSFGAMRDGFNSMFPVFGRFTGAMKGMASAAAKMLGAVAGFLTGPLGILSIGAGLVAIENNWFHLGDLVNSLTRSFRDLRGELRDTMKVFGEEANLSARLEDSLRGFATLTLPSFSIKEKETGGVIATITGGKSFQGQYEDVMAAVENELENLTNESAKRIAETFATLPLIINDRLAQSGSTATSSEQAVGEILLKLLPIATPENASRIEDLLKDSVIEIAMLVAKGGTREEFSALYDVLDDRYAEFGEGAGRIGRQAFIDGFYTRNAEIEGILRTSQQKVDDFYAPILDNLTAAVKSGKYTPEQLGEMIAAPVGGYLVGGIRYGIHRSIADAIGEASPEFKEAFYSLMSAVFGPDNMPDLEDMDLENTLYSKLSEDVTNQLVQIWDNFFSGTQTAVYDALKTFVAADQSDAALQRDALTKFFNTVMPDGQTIQQALEAGNIRPELSGAVDEIVNTGIKLGLIKAADDTTAIEQEAGRTYEDIVSSIVNVFESKGDVVKSINKALKGPTDRESVKNLIRKMSGLAVGRGSRSSAPLAARQIATQFLNEGSQAIIDRFSMAGPRLQRSIIKGLREIKWGKLSTEQQVAFFNVIDFLNPSLKKPIVIPDRIKTKMLGNVNQALVDAFSSMGSASQEGLLERGLAPGQGGAGGGTTESLLDKLIKPQMYLSDTTLADATASGNKIGNNLTSGAEDAMRAGLENDIKPALTSIIDSMKTESVQNSFKSAGTIGGSSFKTGLKDSLISGSTSGTMIAARNSIINTLADGGYAAGGRNAGLSWAGAFNTAVRSAIINTVKMVGFFVIGNSPPKMGPLKNIDKGGYNVGAAWGSNLRRGMLDEVRSGMTDAQYEMSGRGGKFSTEFTNNNKRQIEINLNVESQDGSVNRAQLAEVRKGLMDALVIADLEHMVTVR